MKTINKPAIAFQESSNGRKRYTVETKIAVLDYIKQTGKTRPEVSLETGIHKQSLYEWALAEERLRNGITMTTISPRKIKTITFEQIDTKIAELGNKIKELMREKSALETSKTILASVV